MTYEQRGRIIKEAREAKRLTQQDLAQKFGLGISAISNWETGVRAPRVLEFIELVKWLDLTDKIFLISTPEGNVVAGKNEIEQLKQQLHVLQQKVDQIMRVQAV